MRASQLFTKTSKNLPADETAKNAQLLIRAGYVHKEMAGVYAYLPLGLRVLENIKRIIREEMNAVDGQEIVMTNFNARRNNPYPPLSYPASRSPPLGVGCIGNGN